MATPVLGLHLDHRVAPGEEPRRATAIAELLERPCFASLTRVAAQSRAGDPQHRPKQRAATAESLRDPAAEAVALDCGRQGARIATARICTGPLDAAGVARPFLTSTIAIPAAPAHTRALLDAFVELATLLQAVAGYVAVEPDHDRAHRAALAQAPSREDVRNYYRRAQERRAHCLYDRAIDTRIAGPEWGVLFGPGHLEISAPDPSAFAVIRDAGAAKLALLTEDPADALAHPFERRLDAARRALAPLLMDVSVVPVL